MHPTIPPTLILLFTTLASALPVPLPSPALPGCKSMAELRAGNCAIPNLGGGPPRKLRSYSYPEYDIAKNGCDEAQVAQKACRKLTLSSGIETMIRIDANGDSTTVYKGCDGINGVVPYGCTTWPARR